MADLRGMMARFPTGVGIVTSIGTGGQPWGMTCTSIASVTLEPPCLLVCLRLGSPTLAAVAERGGFALNLLREHARADAELFASGAADRFERIGWRMDRGAQGPHLPGSALCTADCRVLCQFCLGDHMAVFGEVTAITEHAGMAGHPDARPLMYGLHQYIQWPGSPLPAPAAPPALPPDLASPPDLHDQIMLARRPRRARGMPGAGPTACSWHERDLPRARAARRPA